MKNKIFILPIIVFLIIANLFLVSAVWINSTGENQNKDYLNGNFTAYYKLESTSIIDALTGNYNGTGSSSSVTGYYNNGIEINTTSTYFTIPDSVGSNFSIAGWLFWKRDGGDSVVQRLMCDSSEANNDIFINYGTSVITMSASGTGQVTAGTMPEDVWTHFVYTCEDGNESLYLNGLIRASTNDGCNLGTSLTMGAFNTGIRRISGIFDEVAVFNKSLNNTEVLDLNNSIFYNLTAVGEEVLTLEAISSSPANNTETNGNVINYTADISCSEGCANATLYFKNSTDTIHSVFTDLTSLSSISLGNEVNLSSYGSDGYYYWYYDVFDILANTNTSEERDIIVDIHSPTITWNDPATDVFTESSTYQLNISVGNLNLDAVNVSVFNSTNDLTYMNLTTGINSSDFQIDDIVPLDLGENTIEIYAIDYALNTEYQTKSITRQVAPTITIVIPEQDENYTSISTLDYTYTGDCESVWYSLDLGVTNSSVGICGENFTGLSASVGENTWIVYINNSVGTEDSDSVTFNYIVEGEPAYQSGTIYLLLRNSGAGIGVFLQYITLALPTLLLALIIISGVAGIIVGIIFLVNGLAKALTFRSK